MNYTQEELDFLKGVMKKKPQAIWQWKDRKKGISIDESFWMWLFIAVEVLFGGMLILSLLIYGFASIAKIHISEKLVDKACIVYIIITVFAFFIVFLYSILKEECRNRDIVYSDKRCGTHAQIFRLRKHIRALLALQSPDYCDNLSSEDLEKVESDFNHYFLDALPLKPKGLESLTDYTQINFKTRRKYGIKNQSDLNEILQRGKASNDSKLSPFPEVNSIYAKLVALPDDLLSEQGEPESKKYLNV